MLIKRSVFIRELMASGDPKDRAYAGELMDSLYADWGNFRLRLARDAL